MINYRLNEPTPGLRDSPWPGDQSDALDLADGAVDHPRLALVAVEVNPFPSGLLSNHEHLRRDRPPVTTEVTPEPPGRVEIAGRAVHFPQNSGVAGRLQVWEVDDRTGTRRGSAVRTRADGSFGPLKVNGRKHYELVLLRDGQQTYYFYFEPFERTDRSCGYRPPAKAGSPLRGQVPDPHGGHRPARPRVVVGPAHGDRAVRNVPWRARRTFISAPAAGDLNVPDGEASS